MKPLYTSDVFRRHGRDPEEPRLWTGAASFLQLTSRDPQHVADRVRSAGAAISNALEWMEESGVDQMRSGVTGGEGTISKSGLLQLQQFYDLLLQRFSKQLEAIKATKR